MKRRAFVVAGLTGTPPTGLPAKDATTTIPIVCVTGSDPIEQGPPGNLPVPRHWS